MSKKPYIIWEFLKMWLYKTEKSKCTEYFVVGVKWNFLNKHNSENTSW